MKAKITVRPIGDREVLNISVGGVGREELRDTILMNLEQRVAGIKPRCEVVKTMAGIELRADNGTIQLRMSSSGSELDVKGVIILEDEGFRHSSLADYVRESVTSALIG